MRMRFICLFVCMIASACITLAQEGAPTQQVEVRLRLAFEYPAISKYKQKHQPPPAVVWLEPLTANQIMPFTPHQTYTLIQKNRMFSPHLLVIPVGAAVRFPNADPFFHNVFSLFDGKRFDLGLYEAGSSKTVLFPREGVSYIFCNIHPEMSAVVLALSTPLYAIANSDSAFVLHQVPAGDYKLHIWVEGAAQSNLSPLSRTIHVTSHRLDLGEAKIFISRHDAKSHTDEYGHAYHSAPKTDY